MGERFWGIIEIPKRFITDDICDAICSERGWPDVEVRKEIDALPENGIYEIEDDEASYGQFEEIEGTLIEAGIPFDRRSGGKYEFDPETYIYRPESECGQPEKRVTQENNEQGDALIRADVLEKLVKLASKVLKKRLKKLLDETLLDVRSPLQDWADGKLVPKKKEGGSRTT